MNDGYSLIEMLIVIALLALVATLTIPRLTRDESNSSAFAVGLSTYLNTAGHYAQSHETQICVTQQGGKVTTIPQTEEPLPIPGSVALELSDYCYDSQGKVSSTQEITVQNSKDINDTTILTIDPIYGNVRPK